MKGYSPLDFLSICLLCSFSWSAPCGWVVTPPHHCETVTGTHTETPLPLLLYELPGSNCRQCTRKHKHDGIIPTWFLLLNWTPPQAKPLCEQGRKSLYKHSIFSPHTMDLVIPQYRAHDSHIFPQCRHKHSNTHHLCTPGLVLRSSGRCGSLIVHSC